MSLATNSESTESPQDDFAQAVFAGLSAARKHIPCRFLYDARGSELFEDITRLEEYYPTRTEISLLSKHGPEIADRAGEGCAVVEFGSGSSRKTHILLEHMEEASAYVPIDIDDSALKEAAVRIKADFPDLPLHLVHADFSQGIDLPDDIEDAPKLGFFPGSTIGNFEIDDAIDFLADAGNLLGKGSGLLIGADLKKDPDILVPAYDDADGVTADFTLNLVHRINRELGGRLNVACFAHEAVYNEGLGRIEIYLVSLADQDFDLRGRKFSLKSGERIHVENSHKYSVPQFHELANSAGWRPEQVWTDDKDLFSLHYLTRN